MTLVGRSAELAGLEQLLAGAVGIGGVVTVVGPPGSGRTALLAAVAVRARGDGWQVLAGSPTPGLPDLSLWASMLHDIGAPSELSQALLGEDGSALINEAVRWLTGGQRRLLVVDDLDAAGPDSLLLLRGLAGRLLGTSTVLVASATREVGLGRVVRLRGLAETDCAALLPELPEESVHAVWVVSEGLPGLALRLAAQLDDLPAGRDPLVHLALQARPVVEFLRVDDRLVRLTEMALLRAGQGAARARLLARLSRELLGDPLSGPRRRALSDEALTLARSASDGSLLAEVLDGRLHALWDPAGAADRLAAAQDIITLARVAADEPRVRDGLFWQFVALMELARVEEAEQVLVAFERSAAAAGEAQAAVMALSRHAMLATVRGRFGPALDIANRVERQAGECGLPDAQRLVAALRGAVLAEQGNRSSWESAVEVINEVARRLPGHWYEATTVRITAALGRGSEVAADLQRLVPAVLAGSGPRWLGAVTDLSAAAADIGDRIRGQSLYDALLPYQGRLAMWGGANSCNGPVDLFLGRLAVMVGDVGSGVGHLRDAVELSERIGALPSLAHSLAALGDALAGMGDLDGGTAARRRSRELAGQLRMPRLMDEVVVPEDEWSLRGDGRDWWLSAGAEQFRLAGGRGFPQLQMLLAAPHRDISAVVLAAGGAAAPEPGRGVPLLDAAAMSDYRRRLDQLDAELDDADTHGDAGRAARADAERKALLTELTRASGLGGRIRVIGSDAERARVNVTRTLRAAIDRIADVAPRAGTHLQRSIQTGATCRYEPAPDGPIRWRV